MLQNNGQLIVIDGNDGSGKATQIKLLAQRLKKECHLVKVIDFPQYYNNQMGKLIGECLAGKHGDFVGLDPYIASVLFAADRFESSAKIKQWLKDGYVVLADRYASASQIHQAGKIKNSGQRKKMVKWLEKLEFDVFQIPRPDKIIYLDVPVETAQRLNACKDISKKKYLKGAKDQNECDAQFLKNSRQSALSAVKKNNWIMINCLKNGQLMTKKEINDMILDKVRGILK